MRSISPKQEPGWSTQGRFQHTSGHLFRDSPCPIGVALEENQMENGPPANLTHPITTLFPHSD